MPVRRALLVLALILLPVTAHAADDSELPVLDVSVQLDVRDVPGWLTLYDDVLRTPADSPMAFILTVAAGTGETRSIVVDEPKFDVHLNPGAQVFKVSVTGTMSGAQALSMLSVFEQAVLDSADRQVTVAYGLSSATATLVEIRLNRP